MSDLAEGWEASTVGVCFLSIKNGTTTTQNDLGQGVPVSRIETIQNNRFDLNRVRHIDNPSVELIESYRYEKGDIALSHINSIEHVGKSALYAGMPSTLLHGMNLLRLRRGHGFINPQFAHYFMRSNSFREQVRQRVGHAVNQVSINQKNLAEVPFLVAPLDEQRRIVTKLEKVLSRADAAQARLETMPRILKRFRQSVLTAASSGRLTADWRNNLENCLAKSNEPFVTEGPFDIPVGWKWIKWGALAAKEEHAFKRGPFGSALKKEIFVSSGYKVYEQCNPINDDCDLGAYYITEEKFRELRAFKVSAGDMLISCSGVTLGRITEIPIRFQAGIINQALLKVTLDRQIIRNDYFKGYFRSPIFQAHIFDNSRGSAQPNIKGVRELKELPVPVPPLSEQDEIVRRVEALFKTAEALEARYRKAKAYVDKLSQSILSRAFRGELVPTEAELARQEGRDYEPASVLLERIREQRNGTKTKSTATARRRVRK